MESEFLTENSDEYSVNESLSDFAIPTTLHDSLMSRLDRLGPVKEVAQTASAIGREFDRDLLAVVSPITGEELQDAINQLLDAELVFRRGRSREGGFIFKHALVKDAAYGSLLKSARQTLHRRIALALRDKFPQRTNLQRSFACPAVVVRACVSPETVAAKDTQPNGRKLPAAIPRPATDVRCPGVGRQHSIGPERQQWVG